MIGLEKKTPAASHTDNLLELIDAGYMPHCKHTSNFAIDNKQSV